MSQNAQKLPKGWRYLLMAVTAVFVLAAIIADVLLTYEVAFAGRFYRGIKIGSIDVGGLTPGQATLQLQGMASVFNTDGIPFSFKDRQVYIKPTISGALDIDLTYDVFSFDIEGTVDKAYMHGRSGPWAIRIKDQFQTLLQPVYFPVEYQLDQERLNGILKENFAKFEVVAQEAQLLLSEKGKTSPELSIRIQPHKSGTTFDYGQATELAQYSLSKLTYMPVSLVQKESQAKITLAQGTSFLRGADVNRYLDLAPIKLAYEDKSWEITRLDLLRWLNFGFLDGNLSLVLKSPSFDKFLEKIAKEVDKTPIEARFEIKDGKVSEFQVSQDGIKLSKESLSDQLNWAINSGEKEVAVEVENIKAQVTADNINDLGIKEIIGVGKSNFAGSPRNRRHNIAVGVAKLNGVLIRPGEEFSLIKTLGEISGATGYKEELVIKGNKTVPEFGGGLCQIGTTTFRGVLASGLPVIERQNHSYRVRYYEPAGTDATIYFPKPDFRFLNDTGKYVLLQTKIKGNDLIFEYWGTKDGRLAEQSKPRIFNIKPPPPKEIIETEDLKPGEEKCTEKPHYGADASFEYKVTYPSGEVKEEVFKSHYRPWGEVCLVGKKLDEAVASAPGSGIAAEPAPGGVFAGPPGSAPVPDAKTADGSAIPAARAEEPPGLPQ